MTYNLSKNVLILWRITAAMVIVAVYSALLIFAAVSGVWSLYIAIAAVVFYLGLAFLYFPKLLKIQTTVVTKCGVYCRKGIIISREHFFPNARLVYLQRLNLPIFDSFGLSIVLVRGVGHFLLLPPMTKVQTNSFYKIFNSRV